MNRTRFASALAMAALANTLCASSLYAQAELCPGKCDTLWTRVYGGTEADAGCSVEWTFDGGYVIAGYTGSFGAGSADVWLIRTDSTGDTMWTRTFGGTARDYGQSIRQTSDSGYVIAGYTNSYGAGGWDVYLIKTDPRGSAVWTRTYGSGGDDLGYSVEQTTDGGYIIAGETRSIGGGGSDVYVAKTNAVGDTEWTRAYGGTRDDVGCCVHNTPNDGGYVVSGYVGAYHGIGARIWLLKLDAVGDTEWTRVYGDADDARGYAVQQTADKGFVVAGHTDGYAYLIKTDDSGDSAWTKTYGRVLAGRATQNQQTHRGNGGVAGKGNSSTSGGRGANLTQQSANSDMLHSEPRSNVPAAIARFYSVQQTGDGGYVAAGVISPWGPWDLYLVRTNARGDTFWTITLVDSTSGKVGSSVHMSSHGSYIITGVTPDAPGNGDVYLVETDSDKAGIAEPRSGPTWPLAMLLTCEPNPCHGRTAISLQPETHSPVGLTVFDASGCLVHSESGLRDSRLSLDLRALPSGVYFVRVDAGGQSAGTRVILQR
jgi:hypothetical protein